jgi:ArsR family transcriptional regulator, lead/cadmium/zinc/bismuth-responsive transcriptional repressor
MSEIVIDRQANELMVELLKAIAHPIRLSIIQTLLAGENNVGELAKKIDRPQAVVSQQLKVLRLNRLIEMRRDGNFSIYSICDDYIQNMRKMIDCLYNCYDKRVQ